MAQLKPAIRLWEEMCARVCMRVCAFVCVAQGTIFTYLCPHLKTNVPK